MKYSADHFKLASHKTDCLIVPVAEGETQTASFEFLSKRSKGKLAKLLKSGDIASTLGSSRLMFDLCELNTPRILFIGIGNNDEAMAESKFRKLCRDVARNVCALPIKTATSCLTEVNVGDCNENWKIRQSIMALSDECYRFTECKSKAGDNKNTLKQLQFHLSEAASKGCAELAINEASAIANGMNLAKDLGNLPANICTPTYLAQRAKKLATEHKKFKTQILSEADMKKLGMNTLLSVSNGSAEPAKLIIMEYSGNKKSQKPVVLVGKGITFDAGGISIKPAAAMDEMKYDMCGAAAVIGTMHAIAELGIPLNVVGLVAASENLPSGTATKPGDIITSMSGQTVEVLNTDAEGRLVLCDTLTYAERYQPQAVIDVATLTGAMIIALGAHPTGMMANNDGLAQDLTKAGDMIFDRVWRLPIWDEYQEQLDSNFADMANIGGRGAGSITAACFLSRFAKKFDWAHLDIAGTAWNSGKAKGATGRPVPLLTQYLLNRVNG